MDRIFPQPVSNYQVRFLGECFCEISHLGFWLQLKPILIIKLTWGVGEKNVTNTNKALKVLFRLTVRKTIMPIVTFFTVVSKSNSEGKKMRKYKLHF